MKYFEECGYHTTTLSSRWCRECGEEIESGDTCYISSSGVSYLCYECGQIEIEEEK